jgi:hypothetical protein
MHPATLTIITLENEEQIPMNRVLAPSLILSILMVFAGSAAAIVPEKPERRNIVIYNNSARAVYPFIGKSATHTPPGVANPDLWMQARFTDRFPGQNPSYRLLRRNSAIERSSTSATRAT